MSLAQLESFVAIAEEGHMGRAARRLHISQPPLTRRLRQLEEELDVVLFERTSRGMQLSSAGACLLGHARGILDSVHKARLAVQADGVPRPRKESVERALAERHGTRPETGGDA